MTRWGGGWWLVLVLGTGCWSAPDPAGLNEAERDLLAGMALPAGVADAGAGDQARTRLGQALFFDRGLAGLPDGGLLACATCHDPRHAFADCRQARNVSLGVAWTSRNSPPLLDLDLDAVFAWDGRGRDLVSQCEIAFLAKATMAGDAAHLEARLRAVPWYLDLYRLASGGEPDATTVAGQRQVIDQVALAWAAYLLQLRSGPSPFDRFARGEETALGPAEVRGLTLFLTRAGCIECHRGPAFSDGQFHSVGIGQTGPNVPAVDRGQAAGFAYQLGPPFNATNDNGAHAPAELEGRFRTATLRSVALTGPYFHAGQLDTLDQVVRFYNRGGDRAGAALPDSRLVPLGLSDGELDDLVAFLRSLTGAPPADALLQDTSATAGAGPWCP